MKSIQREDKGIYICTIHQSRGFESTSEKSRSINVKVIGKMRENSRFLNVLREAARVFRESKISNEKSIFFLFYQTSLSVN